MIFFGLEKEIGFSITVGDKGIIIKFLWMVFGFMGKEHAVKILKVARLDYEILNDYSEIKKIKAKEHTKGWREGVEHSKSNTEYFEDLYQKEKQKCQKLSEELKEIKPKFEYLEQLVGSISPSQPPHKE